MGFLLQGWLPASLSNARHLQKMLDLLHIDIQGIEQVSMHNSVGHLSELKKNVCGGWKVSKRTQPTVTKFNFFYFLLKSFKQIERQQDINSENQHSVEKYSFGTYHNKIRPNLQITLAPLPP